MKKIYNLILIALFIVAGISANAQYCAPSYSSQCSSGDYINNVYTTGGTTNILNLSTGCNGSINNYISYAATDSVTVSAGGSFILTVQSGSSYGQGFAVWIDLSNDYSFTDVGDNVWNSGTYGTNVFTGSIHIPPGTSTGRHIMRIRCAYATVPTDPCSSYSYGETEDYAVFVLPPPQLPTLITSSPVTVSCGGIADFTATTPDTSIIIRWWDSYTGGNMLGTVASGAIFSIIPLSNTTYYCESFDKNTLASSLSRDSIIVIVNPGTIPSPLSISATPASTCPGGYSSLSANTQFGSVQWFSGSCNGNLIGSSLSGSFLIVSPSSSSTYWASAYCACGSSSCISVTVGINILSLPDTLFASPSTINCGDSTSLSSSQAGYTISWWDASTGGNMIGTSSNVTNLTFYPPGTASYYAESDLFAIGSLTFNYSGAIQTWSVPAGVSSITVDARGASGGYYSPGIGGRGARMTGTFSVTPGTVLSLLVGQCPGSTNLWPGGGGGTFVAYGSNYATATPMIIAGGGGGGYSGTSGIDAPTTQAGTYSAGSDYLGANGFGAIPAPCVGGGGGFYSSGAADTYYLFSGGAGFQQGGQGGCPSPTYSASAQCGGFGGGSAGDYVGACNTFGGNGGGYSGGSGYSTNSKYYGEAGGSFNAGTNQQNYSGASGNTGNGIIIISWNSVLCASASRSSISVTVNSGSLPSPTLVSALPDTICPGTSTNLNAKGITGVIEWWDSPAGGSLIGSSGIGLNFSVSPVATTIYYAESYAACGSSISRIPVSVSLANNSIQPDSAVSTMTNICSGYPTTLSETGGFPGNGATWFWYSGSCGGSFSGNGDSINVFPYSSTEYYVRAEGLCNTTTCASILITVVNPVINIGNDTTICSSTINLTASVQNVVPDSYNWYLSSGPTLIGTGQTISVTPSVSSSYYVVISYSFPCSNTLQSGTRNFTVDTVAPSPTSVIVSSSTICQGDSSYLTAYCPMGIIRWWTAQTGGMMIATSSSGASILVIPSITTTYYAEAYAPCGNSSRTPVTILLNSPSSPATSASVSNTILCSGYADTLRAMGGILGAGASWNWYSTLCGGHFEGSGDTLVVYPSMNTVYFVRAENNCNSTSCVSVSVNAQQQVYNNFDTSICMGGTAALRATFSGIPPIMYQWYSYDIQTSTQTFVDTGQSITVSPTKTTLYFVSASYATPCSGTQASNGLMVQVVNLPSSPSLVSATPDSVCFSGISLLNAAPAGIISWWDASIGGNKLGTGENFIVSNSSTNTYFAESDTMESDTIVVQYTGTVQKWTVPSGVTSLTVDANGAQGGYSSSSTGGYGGRVQTDLSVVPGQTLNIFAGGEGTYNQSWGVGGWNGGGNGGFMNGGGGGGATDIRIGGTLLTDRVVVAGGGGGSGYSGGYDLSELSQTYSNNDGGPGGDTIGGNGSYGSSFDSLFCGKGGTQLAGGVGAVGSLPGNIGIGGDAFMQSPGGGGGGGYFGGGGGGDNGYSYDGGGGGGGSNYANSSLCSNTIHTQGSNTGNGYVILAFTRQSSCTNSRVPVTVYVVPQNIGADSISVAQTNICSGSSTTLSPSGGNVYSGAWYLYAGSCGGSLIGSATSQGFIVSPAVSTVYYLRAESACTTTACVSAAINVSQITEYNITGGGTICGAGPGIHVYLSNSDIGNTYQLILNGTNFGSPASGIGSQIDFGPQGPGIYKVEALHNGCSSIMNDSVLINSAPEPMPVVSPSGLTTFCAGGSVQLIANYYPGLIYQWLNYGTVINGATGSNYTAMTSGSYSVFETNMFGCSDTSSVIIVTADSISVPVDSVYAIQPSICSGSSATLGFYGGMPGTASEWYWYSGSCGGTLEGSGISLIVSPTITMVYYIRAEGFCNTTSCMTQMIVVNYVPNSPTSTDAYPSSVNAGQNSMLVVNGSLSSGDYWKWYQNSCGSAMAIGTGNSVTVTPFITTTYYVRTEIGACYSNCLSIIVSVNSLNNPISASATPDTLCFGSSTNLSVVGILNGGQWYWYGGSCGGTFIGTGSPVNDTPASTTIYYVRQEYVTNYSTCVSKTVYVELLSSQATGAVATPSLICSGNQTTLNILGGMLGSYAQWYWYTGSCGGFATGTGASPARAPLLDTTYYVRAESNCNTTACASVFVTVNTASVAPGSASATPAAICLGSTSSLSFIGGTLGKGAEWYWYSGSCGGTFEGNGATISVSPAITTNYYLRGEGNCNTTNCVNITVVVNNYSSPAISATTSSDTACPGTTISLGIIGGTLGIPAAWNWYSGSCGGTSEGNGAPILVIPLVSEVYYVRAEGVCNTTSCVSVAVVVDINSSSPDSLTISSSSICVGSVTSLKFSGGNLGTGAGWYWYGNSCGGNFIGNGDSVTVTPSITTDYFVRAEGICNTTVCVSKEVTVFSFSVQADSILSSSSSTCSGVSDTLGVSGGILGSLADWYWYSGSCGGTFEGSGVSIIVSPTVNTTYYVQAVGICDTTSCVNKSITVNILSIPADSISPAMQVICSGLTTTLSTSGGSLGSSASWYWYSGSCGGTFEGNGSSIIVSPAVTTDYFVRALSVCASTICVSKTIIVYPVSLPADSTTATSTAICAGTSSTLGISGGTLGFGAAWYWYNVSCGGTLIGSGLTMAVTPVSSSTYFLRAEGLCNTTICVSKTILVNSLSVQPDSATTVLNPICSGLSTTLNIAGGVLGSGAVWAWYSATCGGIPVGNGTSVVLSPTVTTVYFVRGEDLCNTTTCVSITIAVFTQSVAPDSISTTTPVICNGGFSTLNISGGFLGQNATWNWYDGACGGTVIGTGTSLTVSPTGSSTYYCLAQGTCNTTNCVSKTINVNILSVTPDSATATSHQICTGNSVTLGISGGSLGSSANWYWYTVSCGGTSVITGASVILSPVNSAVYYSRAEGVCNTTACVSIAITVNTVSTPADSIQSSQVSICAGGTATLGVAGGNPGTNASWYWYSASCGGTYEGSGISIIVGPAASTNYFVRAEGTCNTTACVNKNIIVNPLPVSGAGSNSPVCYGDTLKLFCNMGATYQWTGPGAFTSSLQNPVYPDFISNGMYYVTVTTNSGCTGTDSVSAVLMPMSTLQGVLKYSGGVLSSVNATIELFKEQNSVFMFYDSTSYTSNYTFNNLQPGNYLLKAEIHGNQYPHILPTYFDSAYTWQTADTLIIPCNSILTKDIKMFEMVPQSGGTGIISGNIWYLSASKSIGEPVPGAEVFLSQEPGDDPISDSQTDTSGYYGFGGVPTGYVYQILVDIPGFPLISTYNIHLTQFDFTFQHLNFLVDTSDTGRGIYRQNGTGIISGKFSDFSVSAYPNPFNDKIFINFNLEKSSYVSIEILDIMGRTVGTIVNSRQLSGNYSYTFDGNNAGLAPDIYILKVMVDNSVFIKKIIRNK